MSDSRSARNLCVFCELRPVTQEHSPATWITEMLRERGPFAVSRGAGSNQKVWPSEVLEISVNRACDECNTGWMSAMERGVKPFLERMITTRNLLVRMVPADHERLAAWTVKTAMMLDYALPNGPQIPGHWPLAFYESQRPFSNMAVWLAAYGGELGAVRANRVMLQIGKNETAGIGDDTRGWLLTFNTLHVVYQVFGNLGDEVLPLTDGRVFGRAVVRLWPSEGRSSIAWPANAVAMGDEAMTLFSKRVDFLPP